MDSLLRNVLVVFMVKAISTQAQAESPKIVYGTINGNVTISCPLRDDPSDSFSLIWIGPPFDGGKGVTYITSNDGSNPRTPLGSRLHVVGNPALGEYNLGIFGMNSSDVGIYICEYYPEKREFELRLPVEITSVSITPSKVTVVEGVTSEQIKCETSVSDPQAIVTWYKIRQESAVPLPIQKGISTTREDNVTTSILNFTGKADDNNGKVYCNATHQYQYAKIQSGNVVISVIYTPTMVKIMPPYDPYIIYSGQKNVELQCSVQNTLAVTYAWTYKGLEVGNSSLLMVDAIKNSEGKYTCVCSNGAGKGNATINVIVQYGPDISPFESQKVNESSKFMIDCTFSANPKPTFGQTWWTRLGDDTFRHNRSTLILSNTMRNQSDTYVCHAENTITPSGKSQFTLSDSKSFYLDVLFKPTLSILPKFNPVVTFIDQTDVTLTCTSEANPSEVAYDWTHGSMTIKGSVYRIEKVEMTTAGDYICFGKNSVGASSTAVAIEVLYGPIIEPIQKQYIEEGDDLFLECHVDARPPPVVFWAGPRSFMRSGKTLEFKRIQKTSHGTYSCHASNTLSPSGQRPFQRNATASTEIDVLYSPVVNKMENTSIVEGKTLNLFCTSSANPESELYRWTKKHDENVLHEGPNLSITNILRKDRGIYKCTATNTIAPSHGSKHTGTGYAEVSINVKFPPDSKPSFSGYENDTVLHEGDGNINITCNISTGNPIPMLILNCVNTSLTSVRSDIEAKITQTLRVDRHLNDKICKCSAVSPDSDQSYQFTSSVFFKVMYLKLRTEENTYTCNNAASVNIMCTAMDSKLDYHFIQWEHVIGNSTIRQLTGVDMDGNKNMLAIDICGYQDSGDYICKADNGYFVTTARTTLQINAMPVLARDPKVIFHQTMKTVEFLVFFYSVPKPSLPVWHKGNEVIYLSERFQQKLLPSLLQLTMHGVKTDVFGYRAQMVINRPNDNDLGNYRVTISNSEGIAEMVINLDKLEFDVNAPKNGTSNEVTGSMHGVIIGSSTGALALVIVVTLTIICIRIFLKRKKKENKNGTTTKQNKGKRNKTKTLEKSSEDKGSIDTKNTMSIEMKDDSSYEPMQEVETRYSHTYEPYQFYETPTS